MAKEHVIQEYFSPGQIAEKASISRTTVYELNKKHHFMKKLGYRTLIKWTDFEEALEREMTDYDSE